MQVLAEGKGELFGWYDPDDAREWVLENKSRELKDKTMSAKEAVSKFIRDGDFIASRGERVKSRFHNLPTSYRTENTVDEVLKAHKLETSQDPFQTVLCFAQIDIVTESRFKGYSLDLGLFWVYFPGMKIKDKGRTMPPVESFPRPFGEPNRE